MRLGDNKKLLRVEPELLIEDTILIPRKGCARRECQRHNYRVWYSANWLLP